MKLLRVLITGTIFFAALSVFSQEEELPDIFTDRPDLTEGSSVVPAGLLQWETGFLYTENSYETTTEKFIVYNTSLFRYGLFGVAELRFGVNYGKHTILERDDQSCGCEETVFEKQAIGPFFLGTKIGIIKERKLVPELAFIATFELPNLGEKVFSPDKLAFAFTLAASHTLTKASSLGYNIGVIGGGETEDVIPYITLALGGSIIGNLGGYIELAGDYNFNEVEGNAILDAGFTYLLLKNLQLDLSGGIGLVKTSDDYYVSTGLSWRIPR